MTNNASTNSTTTPQAVKNRYYDKLFLRIAEAKLVHKQLGQINRKIAKGEGGYGTGSVYWTKWVNIPIVTAGQGEGVPTTAVTLSALNVTGSTTQLDNAVSISDILAYTSFGDVMKEAVSRLAYNAGLSIDTYIRQFIANSGTQQLASGAAHFTAVPATATLNISEIRKAVRTLRRNDAFTLEDECFVAVIHPDALYDLQTDTTTGGWLDANKYTSPNATKLMTGEAGKLMKVRFLDSTNAYVNDSAATTAWVASASQYHTSVFGMDAFGVTEMQGLRTFIKGFSSGGTSDPTEKVATAAWKATLGAASLNSSFYVNIKHSVSSTA